MCVYRMTLILLNSNLRVVSEMLINFFTQYAKSEGEVRHS